METRGRKPKIYPNEEIQNILYRYTQEENASGWIKYSEMYRFAKKLYENGEIPYLLSEDYWRRDGRQGKEIIDKVNKIYESTLVSKKTSKSDIYVDTEECVNKFFTGKPSDKRRLIEALKINEKKARDYNDLLDRVDALKASVEVLTSDKKSLEKLIGEYQSILFSWFNSSNKSDIPLINLITTGSSRHPIIDMFFETAFSSPSEGYAKFEEYRRRNAQSAEGTSDVMNDVVTPMRQSKLKAIRDKHKKS